MICCATPDATAAFATAGAKVLNNLGSNGFGIIYSDPKLKLCWLYAMFTKSGTADFASSASALTAANFIASLIDFARTSNAPRKIYGKPSTLLT